MIHEFIGNFETPILDTLDSEKFEISGWAMDADGEVLESLALDCSGRTFEAILGINRPDVAEAYPGYQGSEKSGFELKAILQSGQHQMELVAITKSGTKIILKQFNIIVPLAPLGMSLETPSLEDSLESGGIRLSGWCCHPQYQVLELSIKLGDNSYSCNYGLERSDVGEALPNWAASVRSGFETLAQVPAGQYQLHVEALLEDGQKVTHNSELFLAVRKTALRTRLQGKVSTFFSFFQFSYKQAKKWHKKSGRLPSLFELPQMAVQAYKLFKHGTSSVDEMLPTGFSLPEYEDKYDSWLQFNEWNMFRDTELKRRLNKLKYKPLISVIMPVYNPPIEYLKIAIESIRAQCYENWELCIADDCSTDPLIHDYLNQIAKDDDRILVKFREENGNISRATNSAAELASGDFIAFFDNDDVLTADALAEVALYVNENPETDFLYSDDDKINELGERFAPQFKPDWSPELLLSYMYFSHLSVVRRELFNDIGGIRVGYEGSQDYDFALRATEKARHVGHIPKILYHWRVLPGSTAQSGDAKPESINAGLCAVEDAISRRNINAIVEQPEWAKDGGLGIFSLEFPDEGPSVSIIIPTKNSLDVLSACIHSLKCTSYRNYEVIIIDNDSDDPATLNYFKRCKHKVLKISSPESGFNYSYLNNKAVEEANSDFVLFLNNDTVVKDPKWLSRMVGYGQINGVGAVGARLLYPDGKIQHAGIIHGYYKGMVGPAHKLLPSWNNGYLSYTAVSRNYLAVTAACLLIPRKVFVDIGGFNETEFGVAYNDIDLCYRLVDENYRCVYSSGSELLHYEGHSRGHEDKPSEEAEFKRKYQYIVDPYYNPNLSLENEQFEILPRSSEMLKPSSPIRALMVAFNLNLEGAPYSQFELTVGLKRTGIIEPVVYCPVDGPLRSLYEAEGIEVIVRPHPLTDVHDIKLYDKAISVFSDFIKDLSVNVVYGNTLQTFYAIESANLLKVPSIWNPRESEPWQTYFNHFGDSIATRALNCFAYPYRIVFVSDATKQGCSQLNSSNNFTTIYNGLDPVRAKKERSVYTRESSRSELKVEQDELMVLLLGTVCERKGQIDLVNAIEELKLSQTVDNMRFFIVGDRNSSYSLRLHEQVSQLPENVRTRVTIIEETKNTALYFSAADIFVCSSRVESYPRVILEAMYYGLAIISTPVYGISEQLTDNISALFYEPGDVSKLASHLSTLASSSETRERLAINAGLRLERLTSFDEMISHYSECFIGAYFSKAAK